MAAKLDLTQAQVRALCEGAKKAGYIPVIEFGETIVKLVPQEEATPKKPGVDGKKEIRL